MGKKRIKNKDLLEIEVKVKNIIEIRIGFTELIFSSMLGSGEQFDKVAWTVIETLNPELAKTLLAKPRDGPYSGGHRVLVSAFREDSMGQLHEKVAEWSKKLFSNKDIIIQTGILNIKTNTVLPVAHIPIMIVTVLKCESKRPLTQIYESVILKPA